MSNQSVERRLIVLDKNFLLSVGGSEFKNLSATYQFLLTENLIGECFQYLPKQDSNDPEYEQKRRQAINGLKKFSDGENTLARIDGVGPLIFAELSSGHPCWPLGDYGNKEVYINQSYLSGELELQQAHLGGLAEWKEQLLDRFDIESKTSQLSHSPVVEWDAELKALRASGDVQTLRKVFIRKLPELRSRIGTDVEIVRAHYAWLRPFQYPAAKKLDSRWMLYRLIQASLWMHLDSIEVRFGAGGLSQRNFTHEWIDYSYCMIASQIGAIATNEKKQKERFLRMCPDGLILWKNHITNLVEEWR